MPNWPLSDAPKDLTGKIFALTGTSSGIGTVIAHELARRGAKVVAGNRNMQKADQAMAAGQSASDDLSEFSIAELMCCVSRLCPSLCQARSWMN